MKKKIQIFNQTKKIYDFLDQPMAKLTVQSHQLGKYADDDDDCYVIRINIIY